MKWSEKDECWDILNIYWLYTGSCNPQNILHNCRAKMQGRTKKWNKKQTRTSALSFKITHTASAMVANAYNINTLRIQIRNIRSYGLTLLQNQFETSFCYVEPYLKECSDKKNHTYSLKLLFINTEYSQ